MCLCASRGGADTETETEDSKRAGSSNPPTRRPSAEPELRMSFSTDSATQASLKYVLSLMFIKLSIIAYYLNLFFPNRSPGLSYYQNSKGIGE